MRSAFNGSMLAGILAIAAASMPCWAPASNALPRPRNRGRKTGGGRTYRYADRTYRYSDQFMTRPNIVAWNQAVDDKKQAKRARQLARRAAQGAMS